MTVQSIVGSLCKRLIRLGDQLERSLRSQVRVSSLPMQPRIYYHWRTPFKTQTFHILNIDLLEDEIDEICISAARQLEENRSGIKIIGFDIGITDQGDIWIIEGNHTPDLSMFYMLEDKRIYMNILKAKRNMTTIHKS